MQVLLLLFSAFEEAHCTTRLLLLLLLGGSHLHWRTSSGLLLAHQHVELLQLHVLSRSESTIFVFCSSCILMRFIIHIDIDLRSGAAWAARSQTAIHTRWGDLICDSVDADWFVCWTASKGLALALCCRQVADGLDCHVLGIAFEWGLHLELFGRRGGRWLLILPATWSSWLSWPYLDDAVATPRVEQLLGLVCFEDVDVIVVCIEDAISFWEATLGQVVESEVLIARATDQRWSIVHHG